MPSPGWWTIVPLSWAHNHHEGTNLKIRILSAWYKNRAPSWNRIKIIITMCQNRNSRMCNSQNPMKDQVKVVEKDCGKRITPPWIWIQSKWTRIWEMLIDLIEVQKTLLKINIKSQSNLRIAVHKAPLIRTIEITGKSKLIWWKAIVFPARRIKGSKTTEDTWAIPT